MPKDPLFNEVVNKIVETIFLGFNYTDPNNPGFAQRLPAPIEGVIKKLMDELDFEEVKVRVQKELETKYMDEVVNKVVLNIRENICEKEFGRDTGKFANFVTDGLGQAITNALDSSKEFRNQINDTKKCQKVTIEVKIRNCLKKALMLIKNVVKDLLMLLLILMMVVKQKLDYK